MVMALLLGDTYDEGVARCRAAGLETTPQALRENLLQCKALGYFAPPPPQLVLMRDMDKFIRLLLAHQPMKMMLFMAQSCNLRCKYCYGIEGNYEDKGSLMPERVAHAAVDYLLRSGPDRPHYYIYFFGGEPLLNLEVLKSTVAYARRRVAALGKTVEFGLTTNGVLLTHETSRYLIDEDFQIVVSMDGSPDQHDVNRPTKGGGGSSRHVLKGLQRLQPLVRRRNQLKIRATMSHQNHDPLAIAAYFDSLGIERYGIGSTIERSGNSQPTDLKTEDYEHLDVTFDTVVDDISRRLEGGEPMPRYNPIFKGVTALAKGMTRPGIGCGVCRNDQGIGTDGRIYPCHRYVGLENYVLGDVFVGIDKQKTRAVYQQFLDMWDRHCKNCWARYACSGACAWQHSHDDGQLRDPIGEQCNSIRHSLQRTIWLSNHMAQNHPREYSALTTDFEAHRSDDSSQHGCVQPA
jgi:uncharacterized protein